MKVLPHIHKKYYPAGNRSYWIVSALPPKGERRIEHFKLWQQAYAFCLKLNRKIAEDLGRGGEQYMIQRAERLEGTVLFSRPAGPC